MSRQQRIVGCIYGSLRPQVDLPTLLRLCADGSIPPTEVNSVVLLEDVPGIFDAPPQGLRTVVTFL